MPNLDFLSLENILSFATACEQVANTLLSKIDEGYTYTIIPSRGASPIHHFSVLSLRARKPPYPITGPLSRSITLPFTADIDDSNSGHIDSRMIRAFWSHVLAGIIRKQYDNPYVRFYEFLRRELWTDSADPLPPRWDTSSERFLFIDTVISGRAICEIAESFQNLDLTKCHFVLLIEGKGERLHPQYKNKIYKLEAEGRATLIYLSEILTEDRGPALNGTWCTTFPDIMNHAIDTIPLFKQSKIIGASIWYHEISGNKYYRMTHGGLYTTVFALIGGHADEEITENFRRGIIQAVTDGDILSPACTKKIVKNRLQNPKTVSEYRQNKIPKLENISISKTHVVRGELVKGEAEQLIRKFSDEYLTGKIPPAFVW